MPGTVRRQVDRQVESTIRHTDADAAMMTLPSRPDSANNTVCHHVERSEGGGCQCDSSLSCFNRSSDGPYKRARIRTATRCNSGDAATATRARSTVEATSRG